MAHRVFPALRLRNGSLWPSRVAEAIVLAMVCGAPWMFGAVEAWSELPLLVGAGAVAVLAALSGRNAPGWGTLASPPSLALAGLVVLALIQVVPLPGGLLAVLDPSAAALRRELLPETPERVLGDTAPPVPLPPATLSQRPGATYAAAARLAAAWLLFQGVAGLGRGGGYEAFRRFGWVVAVNAALLGLFALVQALTWNGRIYWYFPSPNASWSSGGPFISHTQLAEYLNLGLGLALGLLLGGLRAGGTGGRSGYVWAAYLVGVLLLGLVTAQSRGGFLAMLVGLAVTAVGLRARRRAVLAGLGAAVVLLAVFLVALGDAAPYLARLGTILDPGDKGYLSRVALWRDVLGAFRDHPLWGTGLATFGAAANPYGRSDSGVFWAHAESTYVELLVEGGGVGFGLALAYVVAVARRAGRAAAAAPRPADRALVVAAGAGGVAVLTQFVSDFGMYVPGVAVPLLALSAHLCGLGAVPPTHPPAPTGGRRTGWLPRVAPALALALVAAIVGAHGVRRARAEAAVAEFRMSLDPELLLLPGLPAWTTDELERRLAAVRRALRLAPEWVEGHEEAGVMELALYGATVDGWLAASVPDAGERALMADPLWLLDVLHGGGADAETLVGQEPVRRHLVPAARSFLEARRRSPVAPLAHAELGALAWLLSPGSADVHLRRALRTAGPHAALPLYVAEVARRSGDTALAARAWRQGLQLGDGGWTVIADAVADLPPDQILDRVIPGDRPHLALLFADRLYPPPDDRGRRDRFLRWAAERLPAEPGLPAAERLWFEGQAWAGLGAREKARRRLEAALALEPGRFEWRGALIHWLLAWGEPEDAHNLALTGMHLSGGRPEARRALDETAEALARGAAPDATARRPTKPAPAPGGGLR